MCITKDKDSCLSGKIECTLCGTGTDNRAHSQVPGGARRIYIIWFLPRLKEGWLETCKNKVLHMTVLLIFHASTTCQFLTDAGHSNFN